MATTFDISFLAPVRPPGSQHILMETFAKKDLSKVSSQVASLHSYTVPVESNLFCMKLIVVIRSVRLPLLPTPRTAADLEPVLALLSAP